MLLVFLFLTCERSSCVKPKRSYRDMTGSGVVFAAVGRASVEGCSGVEVQIELFREVAVKEILHVGGDGFHTPVMQVDACRLAVGIGTDMATCMHDGGGMLEILVLRRPVGLRADFHERPFE